VDHATLKDALLADAFRPVLVKLGDGTAHPIHHPANVLLLSCKLLIGLDLDESDVPTRQVSVRHDDIVALTPIDDDAAGAAVLD
jgi:hypothetical protein